MVTLLSFFKKHRDRLPKQATVYYFIKKYSNELKEAGIIDIQKRFEQIRIIVLDENKLLEFIEKKREKIAMV